MVSNKKVGTGPVMMVSQKSYGNDTVQPLPLSKKALRLYYYRREKAIDLCLKLLEKDVEVLAVFQPEFFAQSQPGGLQGPDALEGDG